MTTASPIVTTMDVRIHVELTPLPIEIETLRDRISDPDVGAHVWFEGVTRRMTGELETVLLSYEAFEPMAVGILRSIAMQTVDEFLLTRLVVVHRLGVVPIGEASLVVGCSSPHRVAGLKALSKFVDRLKADVPIWKKEHFADGTTQWVHPQ